MADFNVRSDSVDVEQIMRQIRARIREKRGADYTEAELQQLASVKLEKFLDPRGLRSDLVEQFRRHRVVSAEPPKYDFEDTTLYDTHRGFLKFTRKLLHPILKLFINPNPLIHAMHVQAQVNGEFHGRFRQREEMDPLYYEVIHNLVLEVTRLGIEVHNLKMRVESVSSRLDFDERRGRSLENVVQYRPGAVTRPPRDTSRDTPRERDASRDRDGSRERDTSRDTPRDTSRDAPRESPRQAAPAAVAPPPSPAAADQAVVAGRPEGARPETARPDGSRPDGARAEGANGPGGRRRRRRRRRRPGQTMADASAAGGPAAAASPGGSAAGGGAGDDFDDGPDDGAADQ